VIKSWIKEWAGMGEVRIAYTYMVGNLKGKKTTWETDIDLRIIFERIVKDK
jgi:hypothetical protein